MTLFVSPVPNVVLDPVVNLALAEDAGRSGDLTSQATIDPQMRLTAAIRTRRDGIIAGYDAAHRVMSLIDSTVVWSEMVAEGRAVRAGDTLVEVSGSAQSILTAERVMLNFLTLLSGVATLTARYVARTQRTSAQIVATRKTVPGLRAMQIRAVRLGGGMSHRTGLDDAILIKDNHIRAAGNITRTIERARQVAGHMRKVGIEVETIQQLTEIIQAGPDVVLLDNMSLENMRKAVEFVNGRCVTEASGGVNLDTVESIAATGVDYISVGSLTHSAPALDIGLDLD